MSDKSKQIRYPTDNLNTVLVHLQKALGKVSGDAKKDIESADDATRRAFYSVLYLEAQKNQMAEGNEVLLEKVANLEAKVEKLEAKLEAELRRKEHVLTWVVQNQDVPSHVKKALGCEMLKSFMCTPTEDSSEGEA